MAAYEILKGSTANLPFSTRGADRSLAAPDSIPTITGAQLGGNAIATTGFSVVQQQDQVPANITGRYYVRILNTTTSGWADGATGQVHLSATIGGTTVTEEINFRVTAIAAQMPYIDVN